MARVVIGVPSNGEWKAGFGLSLAHLCLRTGSVAGEDILVASQLGSSLSIQRTRIVLAAQEFEATHLLFLDADMTFPPDTLDRLLAWDKQVVAANCPVKRVPSHPTARQWVDGRWELVLSNDAEGLEQVDRVGTGIMLIRMDVFERIAEPWFAFLWEGPGREYQGEDWCLCEQIEDAGIPIFVDHDVSKKVGHIGNFVFSHSLIKPEMLKHPGVAEVRKWKDRGVKMGGE